MSSRPGFARADTDQVVNSEERGSSSKGTYELQDPNPKSGTFVSAKLDDDAPAYEVEDFDEGTNVPIESAKDLVTKIIHVEDDDPNESAVTFRVIFLGTFFSDAEDAVDLICVQVLVSPSSVPSCRKSSTSSLRPFSYLWCS